LNRQVRKFHQVQENKDLKRVFLAEDFCSEAFGFENLGELFLLGGSNPRSGSAFLAGIFLV
jgi:hypothetical protein